MLSKTKLSLYLKNNFNVLLSGLHGVGKTAIVKDVFEEANLNWLYFSAPTMDPWVDFVGVPRVKKLDDGLEVLDLVKPEPFARDEVQAIFFDEFNRASKKVKDAVMELIQFKSINGKKFNNLKVIWASINPYDDAHTYDVEKLDPAIVDRFHIKIDVPYELDSGYLIGAHGDLAKPFIDWWKALPDKEKLDVSPRRLDYAIAVHKKMGDLKDVLPFASNTQKLRTALANMKIRPFMNLKTKEDKQKFFTAENSMRYIDAVIENNSYDLLPYVHREAIETSIISGNTDLAIAVSDIKEIIDNLSKDSKDIVKKVTSQNSNLDIIKNNLTKAQIEAQLPAKAIQCLEDSLNTSVTNNTRASHIGSAISKISLATLSIGTLNLMFAWIAQNHDTLEIIVGNPSSNSAGYSLGNDSVKSLIISITYHIASKLSTDLKLEVLYALETLDETWTGTDQHRRMAYFCEQTLEKKMSLLLDYCKENIGHTSMPSDFAQFELDYEHDQDENGTYELSLGK